MFLSIAILSLLAPASFAAPKSLAQYPVAESRFRFTGPSNTVQTFVQTCNSKGKVKSLQLQVIEGNLVLNTLDVTYVSGRPERLAAKLKLAKGQASPWLVLKDQENPCLNNVKMNVGASNSPTVVRIMGNWEQ
jgi:hypothetical protein